MDTAFHSLHLAQDEVLLVLLVLFPQILLARQTIGATLLLLVIQSLEFEVISALLLLLLAVLELLLLAVLELLLLAWLLLLLVVPGLLLLAWQLLLLLLLLFLLPALLVVLMAAHAALVLLLLLLLSHLRMRLQLRGQRMLKMGFPHLWQVCYLQSTDPDSCCWSCLAELGQQQLR